MSPRRRSSESWSVHPDTRRGIVAVVIFALAFFLSLGFFHAAGAFGQVMDDGMAQVFGWVRFFIPFFLLAWGIYIVAPEKLPLRFSNVLGILLFFISLDPLMHAIVFPAGFEPADAALRLAGGKLGEVIAIPLQRQAGSIGLIVFATAILIIAVLLIFNATLREVLFFVRWAWQGICLLIKTIAGPFQARADLKRRLAQSTQKDTVTTPQGVARSISPEPAPIMKGEAIAVAPKFSKELPQEEESDDLDEPVEPLDEIDEPEAHKQKTVPPKKRHPHIDIPLDLLERRDQKPTSGDITYNREVIRRTLETFGVPVEMAEVAVGPTVTQFTLKPSEGVKLTRITGLHNDLALALAAHPIRIEAPIPGKSLVGIEVPNQSVATVGLREILESKDFRERKTSLTFALGKDVAGKPWVADLGRMPHLLVAGATGSGKSVCLNVLITSLLFTNGPDDVKFIMVDPKRVELQIYNGVPHLITPVITKVPETVNALKWCLREMDRRYDVLAKQGVRDIGTYNERVQDRLPYLVVIVDELADLMSIASAEIEGPIVRLAQMSRAVGIHLVLATQRPSVDVITGLIKANVPARIAFAVASNTDSRTILDQPGADKLLGRGDMLLLTSDMSVPKRLQGAFVSEGEIERFVNFMKSKYDPADYDFQVTERAGVGSTVYGSSGDEDDGDPLLDAAKEEILRAGKASASLLQRRLKVGYARAARLLDLLEQSGFIGPGDGAKPREILQADFLPSPVGPPQEVLEEIPLDVDEG